jgi:hypothetical protein
VESYGFLSFAGFEHGARKRRPVAYHMAIAVSLFDVIQFDMGEFIISSSLYSWLAISPLLYCDLNLRLMLVSLRSTASFSISAQAPNLSKILAMFGASWMPAPTNPRFEAVSKTSICVNPLFARERAHANPPIPGHVSEYGSFCRKGALPAPTIAMCTFLSISMQVILNGIMEWYLKFKTPPLTLQQHRRKL